MRGGDYLIFNVILQEVSENVILQEVSENVILQEVSENEINLLERIKGLESEKGLLYYIL